LRGIAVDILFVMDKRPNAGSIQAVGNYVRAGDELGHRCALYGRDDGRFPGLRFSTDVDAYDRVLFIVESSLNWMSALRVPRILSLVERERRAILDADGMYNAVVVIDDYDHNHPSERDSARWISHLDEIADIILQPTLGDPPAGVAPLPFYGYDPRAEVRPAKRSAKQFDIVHVGHNWWRWQDLHSKILPALTDVRAELDGICFVGSWWTGAPPATPDDHLPAFHVDLHELRRLRIELRPAVHYTQVTHAMSEGRVNIMIQRPLFRHLRLLTSKYFEIFAADTIPLVLLDAEQAEAVYGPAGRELALDGQIGDKIVDALCRPDPYRELVADVRARLRSHHSYQARVSELVRALGG
jgi:hypothetical protein